MTQNRPNNALDPAYVSYTLVIYSGRVPSWFALPPNETEREKGGEGGSACSVDRSRENLLSDYYPPRRRLFSVWPQRIARVSANESASPIVGETLLAIVAAIVAIVVILGRYRDNAITR